MDKKKRMFLAVGLFSLCLLCVGAAPVTATSSEDYQGDGNTLDLGQTQFGDIIVMKGVKKLASLVGSIFSGYWEHSAVYIGNGQILEGWPGGVRILAAASVRSASDAAIYRVKTTATVKTNAVNFMKAQLGKPYDYSWILYPGGKSTASSYWYCSELNWAGYKVNGVEIDANPGFSWSYGYNVAPGELTGTSNVWQVAIGH